MTIPRRKFRTISSSVEKITKPIFSKRGFGEATIVNDWAHIVGDTLARHTVPEQIYHPSSSRSEGTLKLKIDSSALALELQHLIPQLMDKVNTYFGYRAVAKVQIIQGPVPEQQEPEEEPAALSEEDARRLEEKLAFVSDPDLKAALTALGSEVLKD